MSVVEILTKARDLISRPNAWTKGIYKDSKRGVDCYCAIGAVKYFTHDCDGREVAKFLANDYKVSRKPVSDHDATGTVIAYNDKKTTTKKDILALFARAIKRAQKAGA